MTIVPWDNPDVPGLSAVDIAIDYNRHLAMFVQLGDEIDSFIPFSVTCDLIGLDRYQDKFIGKGWSRHPSFLVVLFCGEKIADSLHIEQEESSIQTQPCFPTFETSSSFQTIRGPDAQPLNRLSLISRFNYDNTVRAQSNRSCLGRTNEDPLGLIRFDFTLYNCPVASISPKIIAYGNSIDHRSPDSLVLIDTSNPLISVNLNDLTHTDISFHLSRQTSISTHSILFIDLLCTDKRDPQLPILIESSLRLTSFSPHPVLAKSRIIRPIAPVSSLIESSIVVPDLIPHRNHVNFQFNHLSWPKKTHHQSGEKLKIRLEFFHRSLAFQGKFSCLLHDRSKSNTFEITTGFFSHADDSNWGTPVSIPDLSHDYFHFEIDYYMLEDHIHLSNNVSFTLNCTNANIIPVINSVDGSLATLDYLVVSTLIDQVNYDVSDSPQTGIDNITNQNFSDRMNSNHQNPDSPISQQASPVEHSRRNYGRLADFRQTMIPWGETPVKQGFGQIILISSSIVLLIVLIFALHIIAQFCIPKHELD